MENPSMIAAAILFFGGIPFLVFLGSKLGLLRNPQPRIQSRNIYAFVVGLFFVVVFLLMFRPQIPALLLSAALALAVAIPAMLLMPWYYSRKIDGDKFLVNRRLRKWQPFLVIGVVASVMILGNTPIGKRFMEMHWLVLALAMAWPIAMVYAYVHLSRREQLLGRPIVEELADD